MQNPYDVAPLLDQGDQEDSTLYEAVGRALTQWEMLEGTLARIFAALCGAKPFTQEGASRAYGVVVSFGGRSEMLSAALAVFPRRDIEPAKSLSNLLTRTGRFSARRNEIAHGVVTGVSEDGDFRGHYLVPAHYSSKKRGPLPLAPENITDEEARAMLRVHSFGKYAYTSEQVGEYRRQFLLLNAEAIEIAHGLAVQAFEDG